MDYLARALELADRALGRTSPNPAVGAVVVKDGLVVGEGFTLPAGGHHAEVVALNAAGESARGADLYVTLEPCSHFGRTPPCADAIVAAGIRAVYASIGDPNPRVNGLGFAKLRQAGVEVNVGVHAREAEQLNAAFFHYVRAGRPFVTAKWAMTLDGKIATKSGDSRWITSADARRLVHQERDASDAILVGVGTVLADDPALTVRLDPDDDRRAPRTRGPWRVVVDSRVRTPPTAQLLRENADGRTLILTTVAAPAERVAAIADAGVEVAMCAATPDSRVDLAAALAELARRGAIRVLVEGGGELIGALFDARLVDRVLAFVAPKIVGGAGALTPAGGRGITTMAEALGIAEPTVRIVEPDVVVEGRINWLTP